MTQIIAQLAIHFSYFKNLTISEAGYVRIKCSVSQRLQEKSVTLAPVQIKSLTPINTSQLSNSEYVSRPIEVRKNANNKCLRIDQICIFEYLTDSEKILNTQLYCKVQLEYTSQLTKLPYYITKFSTELQILKLHCMTEYLAVSFDKCNESGIHSTISCTITKICKLEDTSSRVLLKLLKQDLDYFKEQYQLSRMLQQQEEMPIMHAIRSSHPTMHRQLQKECYQLVQDINVYWAQYLQNLVSNKDVMELLREYYEEKVKQHYLKKSTVVTFKNNNWKIRSNKNLVAQYQVHSQKLLSLETHPSDQGISAIHWDYFQNSNSTSVMISQANQNNEPIFHRDLPLKHLVVLVHGFKASKIDMFLFKTILSAKFKHCQILMSEINYGVTDKSIKYLGQRLADEVTVYIKKCQLKEFRLSFMGHSMGGIIIRAAVPFLQSHHDKLYSYISMGSPHLGYLQNSSWLIETGLWYLSRWENISSIKQLTFKDSSQLRKCFMYELSQNNGLSSFQNIAFVSSFQDQYVPYESSRVQKTEKLLIELKNRSEQSLIIEKMIDNILNSLKNCRRLHRVNVYFQIQKKSQNKGLLNNIQKMIGRTAHLCYVDDSQFAKQFVTNFDSYFA